MYPDKSKSSLVSKVITQSIAILVFVLVPVLVTLMAPRTTILLRRNNNEVSAEVTRHTLLFIPFYTTKIQPLVDAESIVYEAKSIKEDRSRNRKAAMQIADGSVLLIGIEQDSQVQSTYEDAPKQTEQIQDFIQQKSYETLTITANAPWMLTYVLGGIMTCFTALYCIGSLLAIVRYLVKSILPVRETN